MSEIEALLEIADAIKTVAVVLSMLGVAMCLMLAIRRKEVRDD